MASVNKAIIIGNLGKDPEVRYTASGEALCNITVATSETWKDKASGEKKEATEWHRISFFGKLVAGLCRGKHPDPQMDRQGRSGALHHGDSR